MESVDKFEQFLEKISFSSTFWGSHKHRYLESAAALFRAVEMGGARKRALEVGASYVFAEWLKVLNFESVDVTDFDPDRSGDRKLTIRSPFHQATGSEFTAFNINLENDTFDCEDETYDLVLCFEVLEHMDVDPMFLMSELNRITKSGGYLILSTPNSTSSQLVYAILNGEAPQFYMLYQKNRDPYRHNFEYSPRQINTIVNASGFTNLHFWTKDTFQSPNQVALDLLAQRGFPIDHRGDNMFMIAQKTAQVQERYPAGIYETNW
jgi:SAM-dependent methyltransferase